MKDWPRYAEAARLYATGLSYRKVGRIMGVSGERVRQMIAKHRLKFDREAYEREQDANRKWRRKLQVAKGLQSGLDQLDSVIP